MTASVPGESNEGAEARPRKRFARAGRVLRHADFERVYKQGRRHFSASLTIFYLPRLESKGDQRGGLRVGFTVGRAFGGAVQRNRIKRRLREAVRLTRPWPGADADVVINPKKVIANVEFSALLNEARQAFVIIERKLANNPREQETQGGNTKS